MSELIQLLDATYVLSFTWHEWKSIMSLNEKTKQSTKEQSLVQNCELLQKLQSDVLTFQN